MPLLECRVCHYALYPLPARLLCYDSSHRPFCRVYKDWRCLQCYRTTRFEQGVHEDRVQQRERFESRYCTGHRSLLKAYWNL